MNEKIPRRGRIRQRGVTLVEVLIVVAIMSMIAGTVTLVAFPLFRKARVRTAAIGAGAVREAATMYVEVERIDEGPPCPTVPDLVAARMLASDKTRDPWGTHFRVLCEERALHGVSNGKDHRPDTADDVRDDVSPADVERIAEM
jgi:general secretion pathway protein G